MNNHRLTRQQKAIYDYLLDRRKRGEHAPSLVEICHDLGLKSRGSLHKHIQALVDANLVEPLMGQKRGVRVITPEYLEESSLPFVGKIAAGNPIEAIEDSEYIGVPSWLQTNKQCFVLEVEGDSMIDIGVHDGDRVVIEQCNNAKNGKIVVALIDGEDATLKRIEQKPGVVILYPENKTMKPMRYKPEQVQIQGVLVGQMRSYR